MTNKKNNNNNNVIHINQLVTNVTLLQLAKEVESLKNKHKETCEMAVRAILHALDFKDHYTFGHSMRVAYYSLNLGRALELPPEDIYELELSALFHDIGKIGVPDSVLLKPGRLNEEEYNMMKTHPEKSFEILEGFEPFDKIAIYAKHHHERYDGFGYPDRLAGEEIPLFSRIILIADTFDAMTSTRPYRKGLAYEIAFDELRMFAGSQFDPFLVEHFIKAMQIEAQNNARTFELNIIDGQFTKEAA